jgi:hypothetical protein
MDRKVSTRAETDANLRGAADHLLLAGRLLHQLAQDDAKAEPIQSRALEGPSTLKLWWGRRQQGVYGTSLRVRSRSRSW